MSNNSRLVEILMDALTFAKTKSHLNLRDPYSKWSSHEAIVQEIGDHLDFVKHGEADWDRLQMIFAPTAGLNEIVTDEGEAQYLVLADRFDKIYKSAN